MAIEELESYRVEAHTRDGKQSVTIIKIPRQECWRDSSSPMTNRKNIAPRYTTESGQTVERIGNGELHVPGFGVVVEPV